MQLVSPGAWLSDLCQERYEVREKKTSKKVSKPFWLNLATMICTFCIESCTFGVKTTLVVKVGAMVLYLLVPYEL